MTIEERSSKSVIAKPVRRLAVAIRFLKASPWGEAVSEVD